MISFELYDRLLADRPFKFAPEDVNYTDDSDGKGCSDCIHFYTRETDRWHVCEIMRDIRDDDSEHPIDPDWRCDFWTDDGKEYPHFKGKR